MCLKLLFEALHGVQDGVKHVSFPDLMKIGKFGRPGTKFNEPQLISKFCQTLLVVRL